MTDEQPLKQEKKQQAKKQEDNLGDLAWGIKFFAEGIQGLTKRIQKDNSPQAQEKHNAELIENLKARIEAKKKINAQFNEYKALVDELVKLEREDLANKKNKPKPPGPLSKLGL